MPLNSRELEPRLERLLLGVNGQYVMARPVVGDPLLQTAGRVHLNASITRSIAAQARPLRVWNGIFAAGDRRAKKALEAMSPSRDQRLETTTREKWPQKRLFC